MLFRLVVHRCVAPLILILAFSAYPAAAEGEPASIVDSLLELSDPLGSGWALGDMDGDRETDIAISREVGQTDSGYLYRVELKLSQSEGSGSFTFTDTDDLGVNIAAVDVDGDRNLDLVISARFSLQRIGVWINDGKGSFTQHLYTLYSAPAEPSLQSSRLDVPTQAIDENALQPLHACLPHAAFVREASFSVRAECGTAVDCKFRFSNGRQRLRAPPTASSILVHI